MLIIRVRLQGDLDRNVPQILHPQPAAGQRRPDIQNIALADVEIHVDRVVLHDRRQHRWRRGAADVLADRNQPCCDDAVERRRNLRIVVIDLGKLRIVARLVEGRLRGIARRQGLIVVRLGGRLVTQQLGLALERRLRLLQVSLGADLRGFGLLKLDPVGLGLDGEQQRALGHPRAVSVVDLIDEAWDAGDQIGAVHRGEISGRFEIAGHRLLRRHGDGDLRGRRRDILVALAACRQHQRGDGHASNRRIDLHTTRVALAHLFGILRSFLLVQQAAQFIAYSLGLVDRPTADKHSLPDLSTRRAAPAIFPWAPAVGRIAAASSMRLGRPPQMKATESRSRKSARDDKWSFSLTRARCVPPRRACAPATTGQSLLPRKRPPNAHRTSSLTGTLPA